MPVTPIATYQGDNRRKVIGYIRVSTPQQALDLDKQASKIRRACEQQGMVPVAIYEDVASGMDADTLSRDGLRDALDLARQQQLPLVVTDRTRISRINGAVERIIQEREVSIISIDDGFLPLSAMPSPGSLQGQRFAEKLADRTKKALGKRRAQGVRLGNPNLAAARPAAAIAKKVKSDDCIREIVKILREEEQTGKLTDRERVELLNRRGVLSGGGRPWTLSGIRRPRRAAREQMALEDEVAEELDAIGFT